MAIIITPKDEAGRTIDTFELLVDTFRNGTLDVPSTNGFAYKNLEAADIEMFFSGQNIAGDDSDPENPVITDGTVNQFDFREFDPEFGIVLLFEGFEGNLSAVDINDAVVKLRDDRTDTDWLDVLGAFDYVMEASAAHVIFRGFGGDDVFHGGRGKDVFDDRFGDDNDVFNGGRGQDTAKAGGGVSDLAGGDGVDLLSFENLANGSPNGVTYSLKTGAYSTSAAIGASGTALKFESVLGTSSRDRLHGSDVANEIDGARGNDRIGGAGGDDTLRGGRGNDLLNGGDGKDKISGGDGSDTIAGSLGADTLDGGDAGDIYRYASVNASGLGPASRDFILSFTQGGANADLIDLDAIDAKAGTGGDQDFSFINTLAFFAEGQVRYFNQNGKTIIEINTSGVDATPEARIAIDGVFTLVGTDFDL